MKAATRPKPRAALRSATAPDTDTERRILDAAHAVFVRRGTAGARMQEIADEAGVNKALLHYYFHTKDQLAAAVFTRAARGLLPRIIEVLSSDAPLEDKVELVVGLELGHLARSPFLPGYVIGEVSQHPERAHQLIEAITGQRPDGIRPRVFEKLRRQIDERVQAGTMRPIAPEQFVINLLSLCIFPFAARPMLMALLGIDARGFDRFIEQRRRDLVQFFTGAMRP